jgi:predicted dehydrogenase
MPRTINYGIIGCGMMGREHLRNIALLDAARVAAIYEPDAAMAAQSQALAPDARLSGSVEDLLATPELDCLLIASPNHRHVEQMEAAARLRPLPLLVEKPAFTAPEDLPRLRRLQAAYPAPIWVAMEYRYMPPVAAFLAEAEAATGGIRMLTIREHRFPFLDKVGHWNRFNRNTGGTFVEKCCHFFDLMRLILRSEPVRIFASGGQDVNHLEERYEDGTPDVLDNGFVLVDFASGARAVLELCMFAEGATRRRSRRSARRARSRRWCRGRNGSGPSIWAARRCRSCCFPRARPRGRWCGRSRWIRRCWMPATTTAPPSISIAASPRWCGANARRWR